MEIEGKHLKELISQWIIHDPKVKIEFRPLQIRLLIDRFVKCRSYKTLGDEYKVHPSKVRQLIHAILIRIEKRINPVIGDLLRRIDNQTKKSKPQHFQFTRIFLN